MSSIVLIVDDDTPTVELLAEVLQDEGYEVRAERDGRAALAMIAAQRPALVLLDLHMPHVNGFEVLRELRGSPATATLPIVAITASATAPERLHALGVEAYIAKPFQLEEVLECVAKYVPPAE